MKSRLKFSCSENGSESFTVGLAPGIHKKIHNQEYRLFDMRKPAKNIKILGVKDNEEFSVFINTYTFSRLAFSIYFDGVNVQQKNGIKSLAEVSTTELSSYGSHPHFIAAGGDNTMFYVNRYSQPSNKNREFVFTHKHANSINLGLLDDISQLSKIEIFFWIEEIKKPNSNSGVKFSRQGPQRSYVGAGESTNKKYSVASEIKNPKFIGKATFIHVPASTVEHLGNLVINREKKSLRPIVDPMDVIPHPKKTKKKKNLIQRLFKL